MDLVLANQIVSVNEVFSRRRDGEFIYRESTLREHERGETRYHRNTKPLTQIERMVWYIGWVWAGPHEVLSHCDP
jgi:hypothetical protein